MKLTPEQVIKYSLYRQGKENQELAYANLSTEELAFCNYCSAVGRLIPEIYTFDFTDPKDREFIQRLLNTTCELLDEYAKPYVNDAGINKAIKYNRDAYLNEHKEDAMPDATNVANYMPSIIYTNVIALGYKFSTKGAISVSIADMVVPEIK